MLQPLCFVLMPFGSKKDPTGRPDIDFNRIYKEAIEPAISAAGMAPVRADEEKTGGIIHKPMFERLLLCEYAIADLTTANANVFYELGVRHTARPCTTQAIFAQHQPIPFDVNFLRALPYDLGKENRFGPRESGALRSGLAQRLKTLRKTAIEELPVDSPVFQLIENWKPEIAHLKTDMFRDQVNANEKLKTAMTGACVPGGLTSRRALRKIEQSLGSLDVREAGIIVDLILSYRTVEGWTEMIELFEQMPEALQRQVMIREQLAFALNRRAEDRKRSAQQRAQDRSRALQILDGVEQEVGPNPETCGLIGRVYKVRWEEATENGNRAADGNLDMAIDAYVRGFEADPRDFYPGINAATLLDVKGDAGALRERDRLLPLVRFAAERKLKQAKPDYWGYATMLELSVLNSDWKSAKHYLTAALARVRESWQPATTAKNLRLIRQGRANRGEQTSELDEILRALRVQQKTAV